MFICGGKSAATPKSFANAARGPSFPVVPPNYTALLRSHVREHNLSVLAASVAALAVAAIGWAVLYGFSYWVAFMFVTVGSLGQNAPGTTFHLGFGAACGVVFFLALLDAWLFPHEEARDGRSLFGHGCDVVLFLPRITLAAGLNFTAWVSLPARVRQAAARLIERLDRENTVAMHELPLDIPHDPTRQRVLAALEITQLVEVRAEKGQLVLRWNALAPEGFRSLAHDAHDEMSRMRRATVLEKEKTLPGPKDHPALGNGDDF